MLDHASSRCYPGADLLELLMPDRASLVRLGRLVMADVAAGRPGANSEMASRLLQKQPEAVLDLIDMLLAEARKPRRNENLVSAFAFMTGQALEAMRYGAEGGQEEAAGMVEAVRQRLLVLSKEDRAEPALLLLILREFALAKLDPGPELRKQMQRLAEETPASAPGPGDIETLDAHFEDLAREAGGDPFQLYEQVREMAEAFPEDHRAAMGAWLLQSREAACTGSRRWLAAGCLAIGPELGRVGHRTGGWDGRRVRFDAQAPHCDAQLAGRG